MKRNRKTYNLTKLISRLKKGIKYGLLINREAPHYFHIKPHHVASIILELF